MILTKTRNGFLFCNICCSYTSYTAYTRLICYNKNMKTLQKIIAAFIISAGLLGATQYAAAQESLFTADQLKGVIAVLQTNLQKTLTAENVIAGKITASEQTTISVINALQTLLKIEETKPPVTRVPSKVLGNYTYRNLQGDISHNVQNEKVQIRVAGELNNGCSVALQPTFKEKNNVFDITLLERSENNVPCTLAIEPYELEFDIPTKELSRGNYSVNINGKEEFSFDVDTRNANSRSNTNANITARTLSSSGNNSNDIAVFTFKAPIKAFDNPIYIPINASESVVLDIDDAQTSAPIDVTPRISISSTATRVTGNDGNQYFRISSDRDITINVTVQPGAGDFYAELNGIRFTGNTVTDANFTNFSGFTLPFGRDWESDVVTLLN